MESNVVLWLKSLCNILISSSNEESSDTMKADPGRGGAGMLSSCNSEDRKDCLTKFLISECSADNNNNSNSSANSNANANKQHNVIGGDVNNINCDYRVVVEKSMADTLQCKQPQLQLDNANNSMVNLNYSDHHNNDHQHHNHHHKQLTVDCVLVDCIDKLLPVAIGLNETRNEINKSEMTKCPKEEELQKSIEKCTEKNLSNGHHHHHYPHIPIAQMVDSANGNINGHNNSDGSSQSSSSSTKSTLSESKDDSAYSTLSKLDSRCITPSTVDCHENSRQTSSETSSPVLAQISTPDVIEMIEPSEQTALINATSAHCDDPNVCCDIIDYKNRLCQQLLLSARPYNRDSLKSGQTFKSSKIIESIIQMIKSEQLCARFDPYITKKKHNFDINRITTVSVTGCTINGFSNVEKADNDCIVRYLGNNRFSIDCIIQIHNLMCDANYSIKFGKKWHKRICLRNKTLCLKLDRCLIYIEVVINTDSKSIRFERFSPISQQQIRCKAKAFSLLSANNLFSRMLRAHFERYFAANVLLLESYARRRLDKSSVLNYDDVVTNTALLKLFGCFETAHNNNNNSNGRTRIFPVQPQRPQTRLLPLPLSKPTSPVLINRTVN